MSPNTCIKFCILSLCILSLMWIHLPILESDCGHLAAYTRLNAQSWEAEIGVRFWTSSTWWGGWWWGICKLNYTKLWQNWRLTSSLALYYWHLALRCDHVLSSFLSASTAATYSFITLTCTTTIISLEPCALNAEFQQCILRFNKMSLLWVYQWKSI
jgi:hypothetical protein